MLAAASILAALALVAGLVLLRLRVKRSRRAIERAIDKAVRRQLEKRAEVGVQLYGWQELEAAQQRAERLCHAEKVKAPKALGARVAKDMKGRTWRRE